jgi:hypothetical protein
MTNEQKRIKYSDEVCREVRYQLAQRGFIYNPDTLCDFLLKWLRVSKASVRFERPKNKTKKTDVKI